MSIPFFISTCNDCWPNTIDGLPPSGELDFIEHNKYSYLCIGEIYDKPADEEDYKEFLAQPFIETFQFYGRWAFGEIESESCPDYCVRLPNELSWCKIKPRNLIEGESYYLKLEIDWFDYRIRVNGADGLGSGCSESETETYVESEERILAITGNNEVTIKIECPEGKSFLAVGYWCKCNCSEGII